MNAEIRGDVESVTKETVAAVTRSFSKLISANVVGCTWITREINVYYENNPPPPALFML